jgi:predicted transcriptional regulator
MIYNSFSAQPEMEIDLPFHLLSILERDGQFGSYDLAQRLDIPRQDVIGAINSLQAHEGLIDTKDDSREEFALTPEGEEIVQSGSHEFNVYEFVGAGGKPKDEVEVRLIPNSIKRLMISEHLREDWYIESACKQVGEDRQILNSNALAPKRGIEWKSHG